MIIAQISDSHITIKNGVIDRNAKQALERAINYINQLSETADVVLLTGDCADSGDMAEYQQVQELLNQLPMPAYVIPGNHDDRKQMLEVFGTQGQSSLEGFMQYVIDDGPLRLIALDTNIPGRNEGQLCDDRLAWLEARLREEPNRPTVIFMHHPPFSTGVAIVDAMGLVNEGVFGNLIEQHKQVEAILSGHVHSTFVRRYRGTVAITCGSTSHQMTIDLQRPTGMTVTKESPVCLLHTWQESTGLLTHTSLIADHGPVTVLHDGEQWLS